MKIFIQARNTFLSERKYITELFFSFLWGIDHELEFNEESGPVKIYSDQGDGCISVNDSFFSMDSSLWLKEPSLPVEPLDVIHSSVFSGQPILCEETIPVIYGKKISEMMVSPEHIHIPVDIFGSAFFMLTRYEEVVKKERDVHGRFPAYASVAFREKFLHRPIINEYFEILWGAIKTLWPGMERKKRSFEIVVSHDVDKPFKYVNMPLTDLIKIVGKDIIRRKSLKTAYRTLRDFCLVRKGDISSDPYNKFDWIMDISEENGVKSCFHFISDNSGKKINCDYSIDSPEIIDTIKKIHSRGHEIGLHPGYDTSGSPDKIKEEFARLRQICEENGIIQKIWGSRQHYLKINVPETWQYLNDAGITYDSSMGYADHIGFRCGVCYEFPLFNIISGEKLELIERPLIVMECTVIDDKYMGLGVSSKAEAEMKALIKTVSMFSGKFTLLWHNNRLSKKCEMKMYYTILNSWRA